MRFSRHSWVLVAAALVALAACGGTSTSGGSSATDQSGAVEPGGCPAVDGSSERRTSFDEYPPMCLEDGAAYSAEVVTNVGTLKIELYPDRAPLAVNSFVVLARYGYFDGITCHRIIPTFVAQCGDPTGTGRGGPGYSFADELPQLGEYQIGSLAMANAGPNTNGSQFFVITGDSGAALQPNYTLFGQVVDSDPTLIALDAAGNPDPASNGVPPLQPVTIESVTIIQS